MKRKAEPKEKPKEEQSRRDTKKVSVCVLVVSDLLLIGIICMLTIGFYRALEREIYNERASYMEEITEQIVATTDTISSSQWDFATVFSNHLQEKQFVGQDELTEHIIWAESSFDQKGMSLLAFDELGNYYDSEGNKARWSGSQAVINGDAPEQQVEIITLPTAASSNDQMIFIQKIEQPVGIGRDGTLLTHVAVVRDMQVFNENFQVPFFNGKGESYIISNVGTRVYRGQTSSDIIGNAYNVLKPLETREFLYSGSYGKLMRAVADEENCSLEFLDADGRRYYVTCSPVGTNDWSLLSIVPSEVVSEGMQHFMNMTIKGMGTIALTAIVIVSLTLLLVVRYRTGQQRIRQQAQTNAALQAAAEAAQEASRAKTVFLAHMSHDIRTPINGIMGMADIAARNREDHDRVTDCMEKITSASHHLLGLVNDVLDMSRIESGKVYLEDKPFDMDSLLEGCYNVVAGQAIERKLTLQKDISRITQQRLRGDALYLRQILINILGNAIKFTPEGGIVSFTASDKVIEDKAELTIVIKDNGIGMREEFQSRIFEPFSQVEESGRSKYQGTGLGMSIVKQLLDLMDGSIELQSVFGQGSTFTVRVCLPIEKPQVQIQETGSKEADLAGLHVLLVEDNELNMEIAGYMLEECGIQVTRAWNGREAVDLFTAGEPGSIDIILMDVMMPVMGGLEAAKAIRSSGKSDAGTVPIVAMTANAYEEDKRAALDAGMNRHLAKPMERSELLAALRELAGSLGIK